MKHEVAHDLPFPLAKKAVNKAFESYSQRFAEYSPTLDWTTDASARAGFSVKGIKLNGSIGVKAKAIELELDVPFLFKVFKNRALSVIEGEIANWVARAKAGELGE